MIRCSKIPYNTVAEANKDSLKISGNIRVYKCKKCFKYHLTSMADKESKSISKKKESQTDKEFKAIREQLSFKDKLINQLNAALDEIRASNNKLSKSLRIEKARFLLRSRLEDEFFKNKPKAFKEWRQLNIDNPFLTEDDFV